MACFEVMSFIIFFLAVFVRSFSAISLLLEQGRPFSARAV